ncbi:hypothetical protein H0H93_003243, partial [Arthromyces matolae]
RDRDLYRHLLECRENDAQMVLNTFQWLLDDPSLSPDLRRSFIVASQRLCKASNLYPECYDLSDIVLSNPYPLIAGGFADIYRGMFEGQEVSLKAIRIYQNTEIKRFLKVGLPFVIRSMG